MNGRMYDPKLGRMLSPDIIVQDAGNTQCYNRYSYCNNNPLMFTDPSGWYVSPNLHKDRPYGMPMGYDYGYDPFNPVLSNFDKINEAIRKTHKGDSDEGENDNKKDDDEPQQATSDYPKSYGEPYMKNGRLFLPEVIIPEPDADDHAYADFVLANNVNGNNNTTSSGVDGNINYPFGPYTSWIGVVGAITDFSRNPVYSQTKYFNKVPKGTDAAVNALLKNTSKTLKTIGWIGEGISNGISARNYYYNNSSGNFAKLNNSVTITSLNFIPIAGPGLSFIMSVADASGYFNSDYQTFDFLENKYGISSYSVGPWGPIFINNKH